MKALSVPKALLWLGIALIVVTGAIHAIDASDAFGDATYKGALFVANAVGALVAAYGIFRGARWGWGLGILVAGGAFVAYVLSRTVGLPMLDAEPDHWFEPLGLTSIIAEALFVLLAAWVLTSVRPALPVGSAPRRVEA